MRGSVRQLLLPLLAATYAVLWTCGSAWHLSTCTHCKHAGESSAHCESVKKSAGCCGTHSGTKCCSHIKAHGHGHDNGVPAPSSHQSHDTPKTPHDSSDCEVCQLFAQPLVFVSLSSVEISLELVAISDFSLPLSVPACELMLATSRGPPAV